MVFFLNCDGLWDRLSKAFSENAMCDKIAIEFRFGDTQNDQDTIRCYQSGLATLC